MVLPLRRSRDGFHWWEGGVLDARGDFVAGHYYDPTRSHNRNIIAGYEVDADIPHVHETVIYGGGSGTSHFGHFLAETLSRLWWFVENYKDSSRLVLNTQGFSLDHYLLELVTRVGIAKERIIFLSQPTRFDRVLIPDQAFFLGSGEFDPIAFRLIFDAIRDSVPRGGVERLYFTRTGFRDSHNTTKLRELNEEMLEDFYRSQGYEIISPERLALSEQISLVAGAGSFASTGGTLSHLVLFSPNRVQQDVILRNSRSFRLHGQWGMSQMREASLSVVDPTLQMLPSSHWVGVVSYAANQHWLDFIADRYDVHDLPEPGSDRLIELIRSWTDLLASATSRDLNLYPGWTVADFVANFYKAFHDEPIDADAMGRLVQRFGTYSTSSAQGDVTVTFSSGEGSIHSSQKVPYGTQVVEPAPPTRAGFEFRGWHTSPRLKTLFDFSAPVTGDKTLHAKWRRVFSGWTGSGR